MGRLSYFGYYAEHLLKAPKNTSEDVGIESK